MYIIKQQILFVLLFSLSLSAGIIKGKVTLGNERITLQGITIYLEERQTYLTTNPKGEFTTVELSTGKYTLEVSFTGYKRERVEELEVREHDTTDVSIHLSESPFLLNEIVITATRTAKQLADVPTPISIISEREIAATNSLQLNNVLCEQTGLNIISDHGAGIQMQGLDPDYTLILVDGDPMIGRTAGTLDLNRLYVNNIKQVEIVKGPTSALYGSDALAGVINIITQQPQQPFSGTFSLRYGTYNSTTLTSSIESRGENLGASLSVNRSSSDGYDLTPETLAPTSPNFTDYTLNPKLIYSLNDALEILLSSRFFHEQQTSQTVLSTTSNAYQESRLNEWNITPKVIYTISPLTKLTSKLFSSSYNTESNLTARPNDSLIERSTFNQGLHKFETELSSTIASSDIVTAGAGYFIESVEADRISGGKRTANSFFAYAQNEWLPMKELDIILSYRMDSHRDYATRFSPKISLMTKPLGWITFRTSYGSGFKAPTFQQLYLDFTNPQVGYSVFGTAGFKEAMNEATANGQIQSLILDPNVIQEIRPEYSLAFDIGLDVEPTENIFLKLNMYRNTINDLIETIPVAYKTNGQMIYSYLNLNRIYTQGIEAELQFTLFNNFLLTAGYQYLEAIDEKALEDVRAGKIFKPTPNGAVRVTEREYGGLFNRSPHSGVLKFLYSNLETGTSFTVRAIAKDRYGLSDRNGNLILDDNSEYVPGYLLLNMSANQNIGYGLTTFFGIDNIFDRTNPESIPSLSGRILYGGISYELK